MNKNSISTKVAIAILIPLFLQACLFVLTILDNGIIDALKENSLNNFEDKGNDKYIYLQNQMLQNWSNINREVENINSEILEILESKNVSIDELNSNNKVSNELLTHISKHILDMVRENYTTDAFLILDTNEENQRNLVEKNGIYIKDTDPISTSKDDSDLYIEIGSKEIINNLKINTNSNLKNKYIFNRDDSNNDFFYKPMKECRRYENIENKNLGYWGKPSIITNKNLKVITYSIPLINNKGNPYGILGVGIDIDYINKILKKDELNKIDSYYITVENNEMDKDKFNIKDVINIANTNEKLFNDYNNSNIKIKKISENIYKLINKKNTTYAFKKELNLYKDDNKFSDEKWYITMFVKEYNLLDKIIELEYHIIISIISSTVIGILIAFILVRKVTKSTRALAQKVRQSNPREPLKLEKINISEIDDLSLAITNLSKNVAYESSKLNKIISLVNLPLGAFKHRKDENIVYCTRGLFDILGVEGLHENDEYLDLDSFKLIIEEATKNKYENEENVYIIKKYNKEDRLIKVLVQEDEVGIFGVITDVTQNILEKVNIEYERDHDVLTNLLNRRAFRRICMNKIDKGNIGIGAVIMFDLDNLKFINDTYGHEYGDEYIKQAADILKEFEKYNSVVARVSGDEFLIFMYGYESKSEIINAVKEIHNKMKNTVFNFPFYNYNKVKIRASVGISWYPENTDDYDTLLKYSDFAMYKIKNTIKGSIAEFNKDEYKEKIALMNNKKDLNKLIDEQLVYYEFQPIVDAYTGKIYGYEMLMRSKLKSLRGPHQILAVASSESRLYEIEKLTWFKGLETVEAYNEELGDSKIFINSIPNHLLYEEDLDELVGKYKKYLNRVVVELLENERANHESISEKKRRIKRYNAKLAIDDFGSGYNNESVLLEITPDFVKIDMEIVREIHKDLNRQDIIKNLISYVAKRNIKVVAEGIETREELEKLIELGVDYVQGYYISKPNTIPPKEDEYLVKEILDINKRIR